MADVHTKEQRSKNMAAIKGRHNKTTEVALLKMLRSNKITGWRRHLRTPGGTPDFVFLKQRTAVFVDGCFWHGCPKCKLVPKTNKTFWKNKISANKKRDNKNARNLVAAGWKVLRVWEHDVKVNSPRIMRRISESLLEAPDSHAHTGQGNHACY